MIADAKLKIKEIQSSLIILQKAIQNKEEKLNYNNIDDYLEIIIEKTTNIINSFSEKLIISFKK